MNSGRAATARAVSEEVFAAFSDVEVRIEHLLAENDLVAQLAHPRTRRDYCRLVTFTMGGRAARDGSRAFRR